ncbi:MAG: hypothetical protein KA715_11645 [Xanthomonadaceae bacterium]|nr:hypothetical protein [Xanthomonadaceae bacterium]
MVVIFSISTATFANPKYGPKAVPLSLGTNQSYFKKNNAPDFWALMPYYVGQETKSGCSAAAFTTTLNAARTVKGLSSDTPLVTFHSLAEKHTDDRYKKTILGGFSIEKFDRSNVAIKKHWEVLKLAVHNLGLENPGTQIDLNVIDSNNLDASRKLFHDKLVENEKTANDFIVINFLQADLTGDPEGPGHVAVIGAYDAAKKLVLVLDPDREWYEPYWSTEEDVFQSVIDPKSDPHPGWIYYRVRK